MLLLPFLNERQVGTVRKARSFPSDCRLNLDCLLSRLVCKQKDVFVSSGEAIAVPPFACKFRKDKDSDLLAVANEDGDILLIDTDRGRGIIKTIRAHHNAIFDICWLPHKNQLITGSGDQRACLFDMKTGQKIGAFKGHTGSIKSVDVCQGENGTIFASGSRDGNISVWDVREKCSALHLKPAILIKSAHHRIMNDNRRKFPCMTPYGVSAVAFKDCQNLASAGVGDGIVKIWDLRKSYITKSDRLPQPRYQMKYCETKAVGYGCTSLVFDSLYKNLYACSTTNTIFQLDCHSYSNISATYTGFNCGTYFVKLALSCDDQYLLCGSSDNKAYIWKTSKPGLPIFELPGHSQEVTSVAWGPYDTTKLVTCGDDNRVLLWSTKYSDESSNKYDKEVMSSSCPYSKNDELIPSCNHDTISIFQSVTPLNTSRATLTPKHKTAPTVRAITNFFSPLTPSALHHSTDENGFHGDISPPQSNHAAQSDSATLIATPQPRSPCKTLHENDIGVTSSNTTPSPQKHSLQGKENASTSRASPTDSVKPNSQHKRKLELSDRFCKYHPSGCGRTKGHTRCGKRITIVPEKVNIKSYFSVSPKE